MAPLANAHRRSGHIVGNAQSHLPPGAASSSSPAALEALGCNRVDLVLLDYDLGDRQNGLQFIGAARKAGFSGRIFIVTAGMNDADYVRALGLGVCGIFLKHGSPELLVEAIHKVMTGETWIDHRCGFSGRIFIVTAGMNDADYIRALGLGVCGIFLKHGSPELLVEAIHKVMTGETWIDHRCIQGLVKALESEGRQARRNQLSERERDVLIRSVHGIEQQGDWRGSEYL